MEFLFIKIDHISVVFQAYALWQPLVDELRTLVIPPITYRALTILESFLSLKILIIDWVTILLASWFAAFVLKAVLSFEQ